MASILQKIIDKKIISENSDKNVITYNCKLPLFIKEIKYKDNKEKTSIFNKIKMLKKELGLKILDSFEEQDKIYILYYENKEILDDLFDSLNYDEINLEGCVEGHSAPINKKEIYNILSKEISTCKIRNENVIGTGFFCRINIDTIPFTLALFTNNHILDRNSIKIGKEIIFEHKNVTTYKTLEINKKRRVFTDEELDYTCIEIFEKDKIFKNNEVEELFKIDQNILENNISSLLNSDIYILQYPKGSEFSFSIGKIDFIDNKIINHTASTIDGSSGSPIIKRNNYSIIGIHYGGKKNLNKKKFVEYNLSTNIFSIINDIKMKLEQEKSNRNKEQNILDEYKKIDKLGLIKYESKNFILINSIDNIYKSEIFYGYTQQRLLKELNDFKKMIPFYEGIQIYGVIDNKCIGVIEGPPKTSYKKGFFLFEIIIDKNYPFPGSKLNFKTKIFHPNIREEDGLLSILGGLQEIFCTALTIGRIVISIQSILDEPNPDTFLNERAAKLYKEDRKKYEETVKEYTVKYANFLNFENELSKYQLNIKHIEKNN